MDTLTIPVLSTPKLEAAIMAAHAAVNTTKQYIHLRDLGRWTASIDRLNQATREQKIYNVELQDAKGWISSGINDATDKVEHTISRTVRDYHEKHFTQYNELVWANVGCTLQMNYAAGRIKRLSKPKVLAELRNITPAIDEYLGLLEEVAAIWQTITNLKPYILRGRVPAENPKVADLTHTGLCPACFDIFKLTPGSKLVHHGFQISVQGHYLGYRHGSCFGVALTPFEKSADGTRAYHAHVTGILHGQQENLRRHTSGEVTQVTRQAYERVPGIGITEVTKVYEVGDPQFADLLARDISKIEWDIRSTQNALDDLAIKIGLWKLMPLYDELNPPKKAE